MSNLNKKNICLLIGSYQSGGAEKHVLDILLNIDRKIYNPYLCVMSDNGILKSKFTELEVPTYVCSDNYGRFRKKIFRIIDFINFIRFLKKNKISIIHIHLVGCYMFGIFSSYVAGVKNKIISWHNIYDNSVRKWDSLICIYENIRSFFRIKIASFLSANIIAVSNDVKNKNCFFFKISNTKVHVVHN